MIIIYLRKYFFLLTHGILKLNGTKNKFTNHYAKFNIFLT